MRKYPFVALFLLLVAAFSSGQQDTPPTPTQLAPEKVYTRGKGVTAPKLRPLDLGPFSTEKCKKKIDGKYMFSLVVDKDGTPSEITLLEPLRTEIDQYVSKIVEADRFIPGIHDGVPVSVRESLEVNLHTCVEPPEVDAANKGYRVRLRSQPEQKLRALPKSEDMPAFDKTYVPATSIDGVHVYKIGEGATFPVPLNIVEAEFSNEARKAKYQGICVISVIVDAEGKPRNIHVVRNLGMGLDEKAMEAISQYRFKPGIKNGVPVPVAIMIEVNFQLY